MVDATLSLRRVQLPVWPALALNLALWLIAWFAAFPVSPWLAAALVLRGAYRRRGPFSY